MARLAPGGPGDPPSPCRRGSVTTVGQFTTRRSPRGGVAVLSIGQAPSPRRRLAAATAARDRSERRPNSIVDVGFPRATSGCNRRATPARVAVDVRRCTVWRLGSNDGRLKDEPAHDRAPGNGRPAQTRDQRHRTHVHGSPFGQSHAVDRPHILRRLLPTRCLRHHRRHRRRLATRLLFGLSRFTWRWLMRAAMLAALVLFAVTAGFAAYAVLMLPDVDPWHTIRLKGEFTAGDESGLDFAGYQAIEAKLFEEQRKAIAAMPTDAPYYVGSRYDPNGPALRLAPGQPYNRSSRRTPAQVRGAALLDSRPVRLAVLDAEPRRRAVRARLRGHDPPPARTRHAAVRHGPHATTTTGWPRCTSPRATSARACRKSLPFYIAGYSTGGSLALDVCTRPHHSGRRPVAARADARPAVLGRRRTGPRRGADARPRPLREAAVRGVREGELAVDRARVRPVQVRLVPRQRVATGAQRDAAPPDAAARRRTGRTPRHDSRQSSRSSRPSTRRSARMASRPRCSRG